MLITALSIALCVAGIIGYSFDLYRHGRQKHYIGWFSSAGFVLLTVPISMRLIVLHLTHWTLPHIQKYVVKIIWMVPLYAVESWLALRFKFMAVYLEKLRESYESYVIFCFLYYLIALLGDEQAIANKLRAQSVESYKSQHWLLSRYFKPLDGAELLSRCKFGVFQYVLIKNLLALAICICTYLGYYEEDNFRLDRLYIYQCLLSNLSQCWALYCLLHFYVLAKDDLAPWRPVGKFICVKTVVFFTWWQAIVIEMAMSTAKELGLEEAEHWTVSEISKGLQDYLICVEMFVASIAFTFAFTHKDYAFQSKASGKEDSHSSYSQRPFLAALLQSSVPDDFLADMRAWGRSITGNSTPRKAAAGAADDDEVDEEEGNVELERLVSDPI